MNPGHVDWRNYKIVIQKTYQVNNSIFFKVIDTHTILLVHADGEVSLIDI